MERNPPSCSTITNTHSVPSWAELKPSNSNAHRQANQKTSLCKHWMQARENGRCVG